jgi:phosphoglycerate-specific signal transduction histidine kinase
MRAEMALVRPNGETVHFDFLSLQSSMRKVESSVPEGRDISELKRAEVALIQSEKPAAVGRLATSIAHEINNPREAVTNLVLPPRDRSVSTFLPRGRRPPPAHFS